MKKTLSYFSLGLAMALLSCEPQLHDRRSAQVPSDIQDKLERAGFNTSEGLRPYKDGYLVEYDIFLTPAQIDQLAEGRVHRAGRTEHYSTNNLISANAGTRVIRVSMDAGFDAYMQTAFNTALARYNDPTLGLRLSFQASPAASADIQILAFYEVSNVLGYSAGFPTNGNPASPIRLNTYYYNNSSQRPDAATVIAHEIGHAIGFRHTDFANRAYSCGGSAVNEGDAGVGANLIPGTPAGPSANSWMLACSSNTDRPFTNDDRIALTTLYGPLRFSLQRWATQQGGYWDAQQWVSGDFNGDGRTDLAKAFNDGGLASIDVHLSVNNSSTFSLQRWATQQGGYSDTQKWFAGDFNGDGRVDMGKVFADNGNASIDIHLSTLSGFVIQRWATQQGGFWDAQQWVVGDFNGDGRSDLAKAFVDGGNASLDVHLSSGSSFSIQRWATQQGGFWNAQKWVAADFNNDGRTDMAKAFTDNGNASIDVHLSNGSSFSIQRWATQQGGFWDTQKWLAGDFTNDGRADFVKVFGSNNLIFADAHLNTGSAFVLNRWLNGQGGYTDAQKWFSGDYNNDGKRDIAKVWNDNNAASIDVHVRN